jgi:hypothetical protein
LDERYEAFCIANPVFYDRLHSTRTDEPSYQIADRALPADWQCVEQESWLVFAPDGVRLPPQGWKIHVGACMENAERILDATWDYCIPRRIEFKCLRSPAALLARVSKYAARGHSGKLVTIYPTDEAACHLILSELGERLEGEPSPYILSDLRWHQGPLYVRYGAFAGRSCVLGDGRIVPAIADATGTLVPDRRDPTFYLPPWVELPEYLRPHFAARNAVRLDDLPYRIDRGLHFSNGGGVYAGVDTRTGTAVVLKEGRPHAGLDARGDDAVVRIDHEYDTLRRLAGIRGVPEVYEVFSIGEHRFMAMEFVDGVPLSRAMVDRYPLSGHEPGPAELAEYTEWALEVYRQVEAAVEAIHDRGVVYGDIHLLNIMVLDGPIVTLLDFEVASAVADARRPALANQGFAPPRGTVGIDIDRYGLACLRLALFLPMTSVLWLSRDKARHYADIVAEHFPVPASFLAEAVAIIAPPGTATRPSPTIDADPAGWPRLRSELSRAIVGSATPDRDDRLFPGDIQQFSAGGGLGLAWGAAGVLYALSVTGAGRHPEFERWLVERAKNPAPGTPLGLYDGLPGVAFALDHLGYGQEALDILAMCLSENWLALGHDLHGGLSGVGMCLFHFADRTGESALRTAGRRAAEAVVERLATVDPSRQTSGGSNPYAGLMRGTAGAALLLLRAYDDTEDAGFLDAAASAIRQDLRCCVTRSTGALEVNEGWRTLPYLDVGSVGIGMVLDEYLARRHDDEFAAASRGVELAARSPMYIQPGLLSGRAGIVLYLAGRSASPATDPLVGAQVRRLSWHAIRHGDGLAFPGTKLLRLSMDLGTGTAGILLALGAALHEEPVHAPLLQIRPSRRPRPGPEFPRQSSWVHSNQT